jgi:hypothetical protein
MPHRRQWRREAAGSGGARRRRPYGAPGLRFEREMSLRDEGKKGKITRGSEGREVRRRRRSSGSSGGGAPAPAGTVLR